ncbi:MAG: PilZ domain-containing protein [Thermodesulfobacteriota bacterium]|nr:PilZ domain-containing protein [Thermodesulfobacteriota bacterium]
MNINMLLDISSDLFLYTPDEVKTKGMITDISGDKAFMFKPEGDTRFPSGSLVKISDGNDSCLARVVEDTGHGLKMELDSYVSPDKERRRYVRVYDKIYYKVRFLAHASDKDNAIDDALTRIRGNRLITESFLEGKYGYPGLDETPYTNEIPFNQALWEVNRKLDLLIHMFLTADFSELMKSAPKDVNISASGIRFISDTPFEGGDLAEVDMILPMTPLLFMKFVAEVIRVKEVAKGATKHHAVSAQFILMEPQDKDEIIRYIFKRQREILRSRQH